MRSDLDFFEEEDQERIVVEEMAALDVNEKENDRGRSKKSPKGKAKQNGTPLELNYFDIELILI